MEKLLDDFSLERGLHAMFTEPPGPGFTYIAGWMRGPEGVLCQEQRGRHAARTILGPGSRPPICRRYGNFGARICSWPGTTPTLPWWSCRACKRFDFLLERQSPSRRHADGNGAFPVQALPGKVPKLFSLRRRR